MQPLILWLLTRVTVRDTWRVCLPENLVLAALCLPQLWWCRSKPHLFIYSSAASPASEHCQSCPDLSLLFHVWQCWKSLRSAKASTSPWLPCMAQAFMVPLHRQKWGRCRDSKSMFSDTNCSHQPQTLSLLCAEMYVFISVSLPSILFSLLTMITYR